MNYQKYKATQVSSQIRHDLRKGKNHTNEHIDPERSHLNYDLAGRDDPYRYYKERLSQVKHQNRSDLNTMCSWIVDLPKNVPTQLQREFFEDAYNCFCERFGEENVISAAVHLDETTPHMHFRFVPVVIDKNKRTEKISSKDCVTRSMLCTIHKDMQDEISAMMGYNISLLTGETQTNKTELQMQCDDLRKEKTALQKEVKGLRAEAQRLNTAITEVKRDERVNAKVAELERSWGQEPDYKEVPSYIDLGEER